MGRIAEILHAESISKVLMDEFELCSERHPTFGMPVLQRQHNKEKLVLLQVEVCLAYLIIQKE